MHHRALFFSAVELCQLLFRKRHYSVHTRVNRGIITHVRMSPRAEFGPALADYDASGSYALAAKELHAEAFALAVPHVGGGSSGLFMRHATTLEKFIDLFKRKP